MTLKEAFPEVAAPMKESEMTTLLKKARERIMSGWHQHGYYDKFGDKENYCILGALGYQYQYIIEPDAPAYKAQEFIRRVSGIESLPKWNDKEGRTKEEVVALMDKAIMKSRLE